jgi:hypothetical protein
VVFKVNAASLTSLLSSSALLATNEAAQAASLDDKLLQDTNGLQTLMEDLTMVPEVPAQKQRLLLGFQPNQHFLPNHLSFRDVERLGVAAGQHYEAMAREAGEPMALRVMSSVSSILQHVPQSASLQPARPWLATLFMMAWELSGSDEAARAPGVISDATDDEKARCAAKFLEWMVGKGKQPGLN